MCRNMVPMLYSGGVQAFFTFLCAATGKNPLLTILVLFLEIIFTVKFAVLDAKWDNLMLNGDTCVFLDFLVFLTSKRTL